MRRIGTQRDRDEDKNDTVVLIVTRVSADDPRPHRDLVPRAHHDLQMAVAAAAKAAAAGNKPFFVVLLSTT